MTDQSGSFLENTLAVYEPHISSILISPAIVANFKAILRQFPGITARDLLLECRLGTDTTEAGIEFCINPAEDDEGLVLPNLQKTISDSPALHADPAWRHLYRFSERWAEPQTDLNNRVAAVWLEFDVDESPPQALVPSIFVGIKPKTLVGVRKAVTMNAFSLLYGSDGDESLLPAPLKATFERCYDTLPLDGYMTWIGPLLSRGSDVARVCVRGLSHPQIIDYLKNNGWLYSLAEVDTVIETAHKISDGTVLCLDIDSNGLRPRIGLECFSAPYISVAQTQLGQLADVLTEMGICTPAQRDALGQWRGYGLKQLKHIPFQHAHNRQIGHIKLIAQPGKPLEAKAYLRMSVVRV